MAFVALVHGACEHGEGQEAERWFQARTTVPRRRMERRFDWVRWSWKLAGKKPGKNGENQEKNGEFDMI